MFFFLPSPGMWSPPPHLPPLPRPRDAARSRRTRARACAYIADAPPSPPSPSLHSEDDTVGDLKKLVAAQTGTRPDKLRIQKWHTVYKVGGWKGQES